jgi:uncharacterized membrane protein YccC
VQAIGTQVRLLMSLGPADKDHAHAARVAIGLVVPGLAIVAVGRPDLLIYAVFGSFTGMYGRAESPGSRIRHQIQAAALLVVGVGIGLGLSHQHVATLTLVTAEVMFAVVASLAADAWGLKPEGPFFGIFALGSVATLPSGHVSPWAALGISAATAAFCIAVSFALAVHGRDLPALRQKPTIQGYTPCEVRVHAARYALAISIAGTCGLVLGFDHANWAMAAAAVPLAAADARGGDRSIHGVMQRGAHRVLGTFAGLVLTGLLLWPNPGPVVLAIVVIALLFPTELFMIRHYGLALGFFTPLILLMIELADPTDPLILVRDRAVDTLIGVIAGIGVAVISRQWGRPRVSAPFVSA